jgi:heme/copper-type cytochrome/quinol oxidase subunit 2
VILILVILISVGVVFPGNRTYLNLDSRLLEVTWTLLPIFILVRIAMPSLYLLCLQDSVFIAPNFTVKMVRNQ